MKGKIREQPSIIMRCGNITSYKAFINLKSDTSSFLYHSAVQSAFFSYSNCSCREGPCNTRKPQQEFLSLQLFPALPRSIWKIKKVLSSRFSNSGKFLKNLKKMPEILRRVWGMEMQGRSKQHGHQKGCCNQYIK